MNNNKYLMIIAGLCITLILQAQVPQKLDFQAIARDAEGIPIASQDIGVKITIVKDSIGGEVVYEQADTITTDISGLFTLKIGDGNVITGDFSEIGWGTGGYYTKVAIDKEGGTNYIDMGAMEMVSVPYALYAERSAVSNSSYWDKSGSSIYYIEGKVGIGTDSPDRQLHLLGDGLIKLKDTGSDEGQWAEINATQSGKLYLTQHDSTGSGNIVIKSNGNIGIGALNPGYQLQVGESGDGTIAMANFWGAFSDKRLKRDFSLIDNPLEKLVLLNGYYYYWSNEKPDQNRQVGLIAQEVEKVLPEIVNTDNEGLKSVDYSKICALLIEVNKEQQQIIQEQQSKTDEQQKEIEDLKSRMAEIEKSQ